MGHWRRTIKTAVAECLDETVRRVKLGLMGAADRICREPAEAVKFLRDLAEAIELRAEAARLRREHGQQQQKAEGGAARGGRRSRGRHGDAAGRND